MNIPFIKYAKIWLVLSACIVILAIGALVKWQVRYGIDFTGGSLLELSFSQNRPAAEEVQNILVKSKVTDAIVQKSGDREFIIRTRFLTEAEHQEALAGIRSTYQKDKVTVEEKRFETIGSSVSEQLRRRAIWAIVLVNVAIIIYIAYAFRGVSKPVASWKYGALAIVALLHDLLVVLGVFAILGHFKGTEVGIDFVVALLTVLGFSVTDTIVVYDRIRENLTRHYGEDFSTIVNRGLNDTLMRSINTTVTVLLPLFALLYFGGSTIHSFALALLIGMASGAYSSIFIASPLLVLAERWQRQKTA